MFSKPIKTTAEEVNRPVIALLKDGRQRDWEWPGVVLAEPQLKGGSKTVSLQRFSMDYLRK